MLEFRKSLCLIACLWLICACPLTLTLAEQASLPAPPVAPAEGAVRFVPLPAQMDFWALDKSLKVFCIPVGAQDCYLIECEGHAMVLDCAAVGREPTPDFLFKLLKALHIDRLDYALNTHPHRDHINGFAELLKYVPANEFLTVFPLKYDKYQRKLIKDVSELGIPVREYKAGEPLPLGSAEVSTYRYRKSLNTNDISLVVHVRYGERSVLFTADIGLTAQRKMAVEYGEAWKSDILKLPHHGVGGIAKELFETAMPELCFVSNGETSRSIKLMRDFIAKRKTPLLYTSRRPLVMLTDGKLWEVQQWDDDSIQMPDYTYIPYSPASQI